MPSCGLQASRCGQGWPAPLWGPRPSPSLGYYAQFQGGTTMDSVVTYN